MARIIDERTGEPVDYSSLLEEAREHATSRGEPLSAACRQIAQEVNSIARDSIERQLRRLRKKQTPQDQGHSDQAQADEPVAGFGVWGRDLQAYAERLEDELGRIEDRQEFSAHRMAQFKARADEIYTLAERRLDYLRTVGRQRAVESLAAHVGRLGVLDPAMDAAAFYDGEVRAMEVTLHIASRVIRDAAQALSFLGDK